MAAKIVIGLVIYILEMHKSHMKCLVFRSDLWEVENLVVMNIRISFMF